MITIRIFLMFFICIVSYEINAQEINEIPLYKEKCLLNKENLREHVEYDEKGNITYIYGEVSPRLLLFKPESPCGTAIIVCPGSGYKKMNIKNTRLIANRLNRMDITVFVLVHRLPSDITGPEKSMAAFQDLQTAIHLVRRRADEWKLSPNKIGVWGSSAGGHLAAMLGTHYADRQITANDYISLRPDFLVLAWPLISFRPGLPHKDSMNNLLGETPTLEQIKYFSLDEWVDETTPTTFLVHAANDSVVPFANSIRFFEALRASNIPAEIHIYEKGGHSAFGLAPEIEDKNSWMTQLEIWLRNQYLLYNSSFKK